MDGRYKALRPRTRGMISSIAQPEGWSGVDQTEQRTSTPTRTFETPLVYFPAEILVGPGETIDIPVPQRCAQVAFIDLVPNVAASINGGGARTIKDGFIYNGDISSLRVATDAAGTVKIQFACW